MTAEFENKIKCYLTEEWVAATPEEHVRQNIMRKLVLEYGYPKDLMAKEFPIQKGSKRIGFADVVIFKSKVNLEQSGIYLIVETKRRERTDGIEQLETYLSPTKAKYGMWYNGVSATYIKVEDGDRPFVETFNIPRYGIETLDLPLKKDLIPAVELRSIFEICHNHIYANEGLLKEKVFNEVLKIIFIKMVDEKKSDKKCRFGITSDEETEVLQGLENDFHQRIVDLFEKVKTDYVDLFSPEETIHLKQQTLAFVVGQLQNYSLINTSLDVKGVAFQTFVYSHQRGERGEYFTPHPVVDLCVNILNPNDDERVLDPACGSGGFLISSMNYVWTRIEENRPDLQVHQREDIKLRFANTYIRGIDINPDLAKVAKMHMILHDDGHAGIFPINGLLPIKKLSDETNEIIQENHFDIIITNPPFGSKGKITDKTILRGFDLGKNWKKDRSASSYAKQEKVLDEQVPDILFIERCIKLLKSDGRMAIVLPNGDLNNITLEHVRQYLFENGRILGVVSLPVGTFKSAGANPISSVLFFQKWGKKNPKLDDYPIYFSQALSIGYNLRVKDARPIYLKNPRGEYVLEGRDPIIDTQLPIIELEFKNFLKQQNCSFAIGAPDTQPHKGRKPSSVLLRRTELTNRIDAGYYATKKDIAEKLGRYELETLGAAFDVIKAKTPKREEYTEEGVPVIKLKNIREDFVDLDDCNFVSERTAEYYVEPLANDILLTAAGEGTIGRACLYRERSKTIATGEVMILRKKKGYDRLNVHFVLWYLRSEHGKAQLERFSRGSSGQQHLYWQDVKGIQIPVMDNDYQMFFEDSFKNAEKTRIALATSHASSLAEIEKLFL